MLPKAINASERYKCFRKVLNACETSVGIFKEDVSFGTQLIGVVTIGGFVFVSCFIVWAALKASVGIRLSPEQEIEGVDAAEFTPAYSLSKTSAIWKGEATIRGKLLTS